MTPDNAIFAYVAYSAVAVIFGGYIVSLVVRGRRTADRERRQAQGLDSRPRD